LVLVTIKVFSKGRICFRFKEEAPEKADHTLVCEHFEDASDAEAGAKTSFERSLEFGGYSSVG
jgi:hypothetical protein